VPLWRSGQVVGAINVAGAHLTRDDLPAIEGVAAAVSVGLQNISLLRAHRSSQPAQELSTRVLQATLQGEALETTLRSTVQALMGTDPRWRGLAITRLDESERLEVLAASGDERLVTQVLAGCERRSWTSWWAQHQHVRCTTCGVTTCALAGIASVPITGRTRMHAGVLTERLFGVLFAHAEGRTEAELTEELSPLAAALGTVLARAEAEHARARADAHLLQAQRLEAVGQLAGGIAHDFNNLLTGIQLSAALIHEDLAPEARIRADIEDILAECDRGARLTRQLLMFGRRHALAPRPLDVGEVAQQMMRLFNRLLGEDIRLVLEVPDPRWSTTADPGALEQLLMNLVVNSRDAMPDGGTITVRVTNHEGIAPPLASKEARAAGDYLCIAVVDTGVGMDEATRARVFEPFFTTKGERGTGLGLAVVYGVVQEAGGWIEVDSKPGRGTTFRAWLPRTLVVGGEERRVARPPPTQKTSVLLVEDDKALAQRVARLLMREGHEVTVVHDVAGARAAAARLGDTLDVVVSDVILPDGTGVTLAAGLRDQHPALRVLLMSGYLDDKNRHAEINRGDWAFLAKPFNSIELLTSLRALIS
jgi:signal transduction histidine kinase/CheY-like chemotaxis protein